MGANGGEFSCQPLARGLPNASIQQVSHVAGQGLQHLRHLRAAFVITAIAVHRQHQRVRSGLGAGLGAQLHQRRESLWLIDGVGDVSLQALAGQRLQAPQRIPAPADGQGVVA